jgi:peptidoglycan/xylan/chitin deacetylase (PgdA/CDA1 family)
MKSKRKIKPIFKFLFYSITLSLVLSTFSVFLLKSLRASEPNTDNIQRTDNFELVAKEDDYLKGITTQQEYSLSSVANFNTDYDVPPKEQPAGTVRIPVLTYHQVAALPSNPKTRDYYVSPEMLEQQLIYLSDKNYKTLTPKEFYDILATGKNPEQKSVLLTFDDGNYNNYANAFPLLKKYKMTGTFYTPSHRSGIKSAQIKEMTNAGMVIEPHGKTHMMLRNVTDSESLYQELVVSKLSIESISGKTVYSFCYPGCEYNGSVTSTLASNGYLLGFSCGRSIDHRLSGRFSLSRMHVYNDMNHFKSILSGVSYYPTY